MNHFLGQLESVVRATAIYSMAMYSWMGQKQSLKLPIRNRPGFSSKIARNYLLSKLTTQLYENFYCRGEPSATFQDFPIRPSVYGMTPFVKDLSRSNSGKGHFEPGWEVLSSESSSIIVRKEGLHLDVKNEDCIDHLMQDRHITVGSRVSIRFPKELLGMSPGFYIALGNKPIEYNENKIVRIYWNLVSEGAVVLVRSVTSLCNQYQVPFNLKVLNNPDSYNIRCDTAVLYIRKIDYGLVSRILEEIYPVVGSFLRERTPSFTKKLARGLSIAEDPGNKESFGQHRCRLLADGMIHAFEEGKKTVEERLQTVIERFTKDGINVEKPYLNHNSIDSYEFELPDKKETTSSYFSKSIGYTSNLQTGVARREKFLLAATRLGRLITKQAIWKGDRCNWLSFNYDLTFSSLGPDLYYGTSGISIFLTRLYLATGDEEFRRTAIGALSQALSSVDSISNPYRLGLYTGRTGVALAAACLGRCLDHTFLDRAFQLIRGFKPEEKYIVNADIISGKAGAIVALLALQEMVDDNNEFLLELATMLGDNLLATAESGNGYSWNSPDVRTGYNLTGFSHGTAGIGYSLLKLFGRTGYSRFHRAAELAFKYERYHFNPSGQNWPDLRMSPSNDVHSSFTTTWCHGAPGIAISRLAAYDETKSIIYRDEALVALRKTANETCNMLNSGTGNFSLCHGLAGNCEILLYGKHVLGKEPVSDMIDIQLVTDVANTGIEKHSETKVPWPCGIQKGEPPGLMTGLSGIGYFYLRLFDSKKNPSILVPI